VGSLIRQLLVTGSSDSSEMKHLKTLYERHEFGGNPPLDTLISELNLISHMYGRAYIIIDGLDECENRKPLVNCVAKLVLAGLNVLVTSRPENDLSQDN
jgi:hypothetical protein